MTLREFIGQIPTMPRGEGERCYFSYKGVTYSCLNTDEAVNRMVKSMYRKLRRNPVSSALKVNRPTANRRKTLDGFIEAGEMENAKEYQDLTGLTVYWYRSMDNDAMSIILQAVEIEKGFVVGICNGVWTVTHLASGRSCTGAHETRKAVIAKFNKIKLRDDFAETCDKAECNYQDNKCLN